MRDELVDQRSSLRVGHAEDAPGVGGEVKRFPAGFRDDAQQRLRHRRHAFSFFVAEFGEAQPGAGVEDRVLGDEALQPPLHLVWQRVIGGAFVGKFGVAADWRNRAGIEQ